MRLLYIHPGPLPSRAAHAVQIAKMCQAFSANGAKVTLVIPRQGKSGKKHYEEIANVYGLDRRSAFRVLPIPVLPVRGGELLFTIMAVLSCLWRPPVIFTRSPSVAFAASRIPWLKTSFELHDPVGGIGPRSFARLKRFISGRTCCRFFVTTDWLRQDCLRHFPGQEERIVVAPNGADAVEESQPVAPLDLQGNFRVGYVGHLYKGKGMEIIGALAPMAPWATFHVVGGMPDDVAEWKARLSDCGNVVFHGYVPHAQTHAYMAAMDVLIAPYMREVAGAGKADRNIAAGMSPLKVFEYMAHGKPIVSSDLGPIREVLVNGVNGILANPEQISEWNSALVRLRDDPALRQELGNKAAEDFSNRYSRKVRAEKMLQAMASC